MHLGGSEMSLTMLGNEPRIPANELWILINEL